MPVNSQSADPGQNPHQGQPIETAGASPQAAEAAVIMLHGRGATAQSILSLSDEFDHPGVMYLAPQAARNTWYPRSGYAPFEDNEPWFSSALDCVSNALEKAAAAGIPPERTLFLGFSQGGCLVSEFVVRNARHYGGLVVLSGSLLGPDRTQSDYDGSLDGMPVFFGCSDDDPYVPVERIRDSARVFSQLDGEVTDRLYEGLGHTINDDEIQMITTFIEHII